MDQINAYCMVLLALFVVLVACVNVVLKNKSKYTKPIMLLIISGMIAVISYGIFLITDTYEIAYLMFNIYCIMTCLLLLFMLYYVAVHTDIKWGKNVLTYLFIVLSSIDVISLVVNVIYRFYFELTRAIILSSDNYFWHITYSKYYLYSFSISLVLMITCLGILLYKTFKSSVLYRSKYNIILVLFSGAMLLNFFSILVGSVVDYSIIMYGGLAIAICYYSLFSFPKDLIYKSNEFIVEEITSAVLCFDIDDKCIFTNKKAEEYFSTDGKLDIDKINNYNTKIKDRLDENNKEYYQWEETVTYKGEPMDVFQEYHLLKDKNEAKIGHFLVIHDWTKEVRTLKEEKYRAIHDNLTGMLNRNSFFEEGKKLLQKSGNTPMYMLAFNTKDFKLINDLFGVDVGDEVLKLQASIIMEHISPRSVSGRITGDRFAMIIPKEAFDEKIFIDAVERIQGLFGKSNYRFHIYMGIYEIAEINEPVENMYDKANLAINSINGNYNRMIAQYDANLMDKLLYEKNIVNEFEYALENGQFSIFFQPQVKEDGKILGAEALVRWQHPTRGIMMPSSFIGIYEKTGLIHKLDRKVWELAVKELVEWKKQGKNDCYISVNISPRDFYYIDIYDEFTALVEKYDIEPRTLRLEITETMVMSDEYKNISIVDKLRKYGFVIEIDDFGSGYSSLNVLKDIMADVIKIDMGFLKETENKERSKTILSSVIMMANNLGMEVITEGVENEAQVNELVQMGCNIFQGYYFGRPLSTIDFRNKYIENM